MTKKPGYVSPLARAALKKSLRVGEEKNKDKKREEEKEEQI